jgi:hypothetical protein
MAHSLLIPMAIIAIAQLLQRHPFAIRQPTQQLFITGVAMKINLGAITGGQQGDFASGQVF